MKQVNRLKLALMFGLTSTFCFSSSPSQAKGLDSLQPQSDMKKSENKPEGLPASDEPNKIDDKSLKAQENTETKLDNKDTSKDQVEQEMPSLKLKDHLFFDTSVAWVSLAKTEETWIPGYSTRIGAGWKVHEFEETKLSLFTTLHYEGTDSLVKKNAMQFRANITSFLPGMMTRYRLKQLDLDGALQIGYTQAISTAIQTKSNISAPAHSGADIRLHGSARWNLSSEISFGAYLDLGFGAFSSIRPGLNVRLSL